MKWITNIDDPNMPDAQDTYSGWCGSWEEYIKWINQHVKGEPKETEKYSVAQLKSWHLIGLYKLSE